MAPKKKIEQEQGASLVDPVYQKFTRGVRRALSSDEFYQFFMESIARSHNEIQFSNRKEVKTVDPVWVEQIEEAMEGFQNIVSMPRQEIKEDILIVNVAHAKKTGSDVVQHLASHAGLVEDYNDDSGDVRPSKVMQKYREESIGLYENRLVFTTLELAHHFVQIRYDALFAAMSDEFGAKLKVQSDMDSATEHVHMDTFIHIKNTESIMDTDEKNRDIFDRISRLHRMLSVFMNTEFARELSKLNRVKGPIHKTNILKRNPNYKAAVKLLEFLRSYDQVGYVIQVVEQAPVVDEQFQQDIFHNVLFNYLVLKGHLEDEKDREVPLQRKPKQRALKPKFIKEIIEELTEDYDLPDVEIRKVLIEELTKEQLMLEEEAERHRLVDEQERQRREEAERLEAERKAEEERLEAERLAEEERKRQEEEAERQRIEAERILREAEDRRRSALFVEELDYFRYYLEKQILARQAAQDEESKREELDDYAEAVRLLDEAMLRKKEEAARARKLKQEAKLRKKAEAEQKAEADKAQAKLQEQLRQVQLELEQAEQRQADLKAMRPYAAEFDLFNRSLPERRQLRAAQLREKQQREAERKAALERRALLKRRAEKSKSPNMLRISG